MLKDYDFDDDDYKPEKLQNDGEEMLKGIQLAFLILYFFVIKFKLPIQTFMMEPNYFIGKRVSPGAF